MIILTGDLTQSARRSEFEKAAKFLALLPAPYLAVPGNHEVPGFNLIRRFMRPFNRYQKYVHADLNPVLSMGEVLVQGLNSARTIVPHWNWARGSLSKAQLDRARQTFCETPSQIKIVALHHPLIDSSRLTGFGTVGGSAEALSAFAETGVDIVMTGHLHVSEVVLHDVALSDASGNAPTVKDHRLGALNSNIIMLMGASATSNRLRGEPNTYFVVSTRAREIEVNERTLRLQTFDAARTSLFKRNEHGWGAV